MIIEWEGQRVLPYLYPFETKPIQLCVIIEWQLISLKDVFVTTKNWEKRYDITLKKSLGQNFLKDSSVADRIVALIPPHCKECVEIGPGSGAMSEALLNRGLRVHAVEIDRRLEELLRDRFKDNSAFKLYMGDYLKFDIPESLRDKSLAVISNLPYNNGTAIIKKVLKDFPKLRVCIFMLQKEVAQRLVSEPGKKSYGSLSVFMQYYFDITVEFNVSPKSFYPQPNVDSTILKFIPKVDKDLGQDPGEFFDFVRQGFAMRRKKLKNNYKFDIMLYARAIGLGDLIRAEEISIENWVKLFKEVKKHGCIDNR